MILTKELLDENIRKKYNKWKRDILRLLTSDEEEATDILNDLIVTLYNRIDEVGFIEVKNLDGYIHIATRYSKTSKTSAYQRLRGQNREYTSLGEALNLPDTRDTYEEIHCFAEVKDCLDESDFSWWEKEIFLRKNLEGKSKSQMADEIGITEGQFNYLYEKVKKYLKNNLKLKDNEQKK